MSAALHLVHNVCGAETADGYWHCINPDHPARPNEHWMVHDA